MYILGQDVVLSKENLFFLLPLCCTAAVFPIPPPTCHRRWERRSPKPTSPRVPTRGRGSIRFLGSVVATARWTSSSLYANIRQSPSTVCFVFFCAIASADNPIVRMYILSLLFVLMFLLLLASLSGLFRPKLCGLPLTASPTSVACVFQKNWYGGMVVCSR